MSRYLKSWALPIFAVLTLVASLAPRAAAAKDAKAGTHATMSISEPVMLAGKQLKPGDYDVFADDTHVSLSSSGKVVAEAPVQWKDDAAKSGSWGIKTEGDKVTEIHFKGKTRFVVISE